MNFDGKVCVFTGGSAGIGEAIIRASAAEGGHALIFDVDRTCGLQIREEIPGSTLVECNVADAVAVERGSHFSSPIAAEATCS